MFFRPALIGLMLAIGPVKAQAEWKMARPGWEYAFPRDHESHPDFKTEWWYFTGNLVAADGREFGYQLTFFRQGVIDPENDVIPLSRFVTRNLQFAHFALSDLGAQKFLFGEKMSRGSFAEAGFQRGETLAWIKDWSCELSGTGEFHLRGNQDGAAIDLRLGPAKPPVIHGTDGVSQKGSGEGQASHYYSFTRLATEGTITKDGAAVTVKGTSWFDHEWATNQLSPEQRGWDWFSVQFDDGSELMLFQLRLKAGGRDTHSGGTYVDANGQATTIGDADFALKPGKTWRSPATKAEYPLLWEVSIPKIALTCQVQAAMSDQELDLAPVAYWEGATRVQGSIGTKAVRGKGYLEMTGYAGELKGLSEPLSRQ